MEQQVKSDGANIRPEWPQGPLTNLERSEFYLREGERLAHMGSWSLRTDGIFDYWSPETFVLFGFDPSEGIPTLPKWLTVLHPDDRDLVAKTLERIFREGVRIDVTYRVDHPKQGKRIMHSTGEPVVEDGKVTRLIGNTLDITEQENATRELKKAFGEIRALKDELYKENIVLRHEIGSTSMFEEVLGTSSALQNVLALAAKVAPTDSSVLIAGETGTGKELIARAIHKRSKRGERSFVGVNCAAIPSSCGVCNSRHRAANPKGHSMKRGSSATTWRSQHEQRNSRRY
jgi:PAS domain S-box-containing protein